MTHIDPLKKGKTLPQDNPNTICDDLTSMERNTWNILKDHLEDIITVSDDEVISAYEVGVGKNENHH